MSSDSNQPVIIITGAGSGVGRALAVLMAQANYHVVLAARTRDDLEHTAQLVRDAVGDAVRTLVVPTDVGDAQAVQRLVDAAVETFSQIDAAANCAGYASRQPIPEVTDDILHTTFRINLAGVVYMTRALWPVFEKQRRGVICNVSSMASVDPYPGLNVYGAAKAAVNIFTKATADEGEAIGIRALCMAPGAIETPMLRGVFDRETVPESATMTPDQAAGVIRDLITGKREARNGETVMLPGLA